MIALILGPETVPSVMDCKYGEVVSDFFSYFCTWLSLPEQLSLSSMTFLREVHFSFEKVFRLPT